ncbi:biotin--[acetyl-CoA-carboxylase] ligase [Arthrobacter sp. BF1]|uniref:biotin--[acetyl-CoA-carboxylase] ligase n=1 Tax=Arthrobacter sp. BF1 TaxID=2821145 RepID=UPI001C4F9A91|nr:biotin--[acetyl-CoA-carboxylase] ligase [Arthrobacter sp. BF1]
MNGAATNPDQNGQTRPHQLPSAALNSAPSKFNSAPIKLNFAHLKSELMHPRGDFGRVDVVDSAGSTNTDLAAGAADVQQYFPSLSVLIADAQPAGKGRLGRAWEVPAGAAMISSVLVWPGEQCAAGESGVANPTETAFAATGYGWLSVLAGVALCQALRTLTGVPATLKWPNDVVVNGKKLAGILAQVVPKPMAPTSQMPTSQVPTSAGQTAHQLSGARTSGSHPSQAQPSAVTGKVGERTQSGIGVVVGVGVNVSAEQTDLPTDRATSLLIEGVQGSGLDRNVLLPAYLNNFARLYQAFVAVGGNAQAPLPGGASAVDLARNLMSTLGQEVRAELPGDTLLYGTAVDLNSDGSLLLRDAAGTEHTVSAGDVVHLRRTGPDGALGYA